MPQLIHRHQEQKENFLKVYFFEVIVIIVNDCKRALELFQACTLARRTAETFLKYSSRSLQFYSLKGEASYRGPELRVKGLLLKS